MLLLVTDEAPFLGVPAGDHLHLALAKLRMQVESGSILGVSSNPFDKLTQICSEAKDMASPINVCQQCA